jgi:hypothetical protein
MKTGQNLKKREGKLLTKTLKERLRLRQRDAERLKIADIRAEDLSDIDPTLPMSAQAGSPEKVRVIAARYQAGLPLWNPGDDSSMLLDHDDDAAVIPVPVPVDDDELDDE